MSERERAATLESMYRDVATLVSDMCVNTDTRRPYPTTLIERALHDAHFSVKTTKTAKQQACMTRPPSLPTVSYISVVYQQSCHQ